MGGTELFIGNVMASIIGPDTLLSRMVFIPAPALFDPIKEAMGGESLSDIFADFLRGTGVPCPELFDEVREVFPDVVELSNIDSPNFRSQMWAWASTGAPKLASNSGNIKVRYLSFLIAS